VPEDVQRRAEQVLVARTVQEPPDLKEVEQVPPRVGLDTQREGMHEASLVVKVGVQEGRPESTARVQTPLEHIWRVHELMEPTAVVQTPPSLTLLYLHEPGGLATLVVQIRRLQSTTAGIPTPVQEPEEAE